MKRWLLFSSAGIAIVLIVVRMVWPNLKIDTTSLILLGIATVALLVALLPITRIKWGEFEADINRDLDSVEKKIVAIEDVDHVFPLQPPQLYPPLPKVGQGEETSPTSPDEESAEWRAETSKLFAGLMDLITSPASDTEKILGQLLAKLYAFTVPLPVG